MISAAIPFPDLSPTLFEITLFGVTLALRWYALAYIVGLILAFRIVRRLMLRPKHWPNETAPMTPDQPEDLLTWMILGVIVGGRLGYVLFYKPQYFLANPGDIPAVWQGGMAFHGGFLGVVIAGVLYCRRHSLPLLSVGDAVAASVPPGLFLGRVANFINAELWGRPTEAPWGVIFPGAAAQDCPGVIGPCARHPSQLYEAGLEGILLGAAMIWAIRRGWLKRPGALIGLFVAGYGLSRFLVEFFRQPDAQFVSPGNPLGLAFHAQGPGLTMGQALSLPMIALGIWMIARARNVAA